MTPFSAAEIDYLICAVIARQSDLKSRKKLIKRFGSPEHATAHEAKLELGEVVLGKLVELEQEL